MRSPAAGGADHADQQQAVADQQRARPLRRAQPVLHLALRGRRRRRRQACVGRQAVLTHRRLVTLAALGTGAAGIAEQTADLPVATRYQMGDQRRRGFAVVEHHAVVQPRRTGAVDQHHRKVHLPLRQLLIRGSRRRQDQTGNAFFVHQLQIRGLAIRVFIGVAQNHAHAGAIRAVLDRAAHGREERVADVGDDQADITDCP